MARARVSRFEHELGSGARARRIPVPVLRPLLPQGLIGYHHEQVGFASWLEPPRPEVTLMVALEGRISADGAPLPHAWVGGLSRHRTIVGVGARYGAVDLKLDPLAARAILGVDLSTLEGRCVALDDVVGIADKRLADELRATADWDRRFDLIERWLLGRLAHGFTADPVVARAFALLSASEGRARIGALCDELGVSPRHLSRRFGAQVGLGPKTVARQLRFAALRRRLDTVGAGAAQRSWTELALAAGYFDQAHLIREFRELAGITPSEFVARRIPQGGLVGDGA